MNDPKIPRLDTDNEYALPDTLPRAMSPEAASVILELVQQVIATLLYFARAAHDKNAQAPAQTPYAQLPQAWQADFAGVAQMAVNGLEAEKRQAAERAARGVAERWMRAEAVPLAANGLSEGWVADEVTLNEFIVQLTRTESPNIVTEVLAAYQEALCQK